MIAVGEIVVGVERREEVGDDVEEREQAVSECFDVRSCQRYLEAGLGYYFLSFVVLGEAMRLDAVVLALGHQVGIE